MGWPQRYKRSVELALAVLVLGAAGSDGIRVCPHHESAAEHGYVAFGVSADQGHPANDRGPCDHDLGVCESIVSDPALPGAGVSVAASRSIETVFSHPGARRVPAAEPSFFHPYPTGPPFLRT